MSKRPPGIEDLRLMCVPSDVQIARDGSWIVWSERSVDHDLDKTIVGLRRASTRPGCGSVNTYEVLTSGAVCDSNPRISPDGEWIAFTRTHVQAKDDKSQSQELCVMPATGGEPRVLVSERGTFGEFSWSPTSDHLVVSFRHADALEQGRSAPLAIRVNRLYYKLDGAGYLPRDRFHLYLLDTRADDARLQPLRTSDTPPERSDWDDTSPQWSPDGTRIGFLCNRRADRDFDIENRDVFVVPVLGGEAVQCTHGRGSVYAIAWSPDSSWLAASACVAPLAKPLAVENVHLYRISTDGREPEINLTPSLDRCVLNLTVDDIWGLSNIPVRPVFSADGRTLYFVVSDQGTAWLGALSLDDAGRPVGAITRLIEDRVVWFFDVADDCLVALTSTETEPGRIEHCRVDGSRREIVCWPMAQYCGEVALRESVELRIATEQGHDMQAWLLLPEPGDSDSDVVGVGAPVPLLLSIHGGPFVHFGRTLSHEAQVFAARGYAVLSVNPRGSQGYGRAFVSVIERNWGVPAYQDLMAAVDHVIARYPIDETRLGVLGGSYGGYMTNWIIAHNHRFKAACTQRTVSLMDALLWSDTGPWIEAELGAAYFDRREIYDRLSPLTYMHAVQTPLLIMQGLADMRTPPDQGERLYTTLRRMGKEVEMVLFPGANHDLSRNGSPAQRIERLRILNEWFDRHLAM